MTRVAIAAPHGRAVDAARAAVAQGGNALDAALAAATVLAVVYPHQCSLGGDLTALHRAPDGSVTAVLSLGAAPAAIDLPALRARGPVMPGQGPHAVTVPGVVAGWGALARAGARLGLAAPLTRAAAIALDGSDVSDGLRRAILARHDAVEADPGLSRLLLADGQPVSRLVQPALAATLAELAEDPDSFYHGALAQRLGAGLAALGSAITAADLAAHVVETPEPLVMDDGDARWWAAPPPAQGATALALLDPELPGSLLTRAQAAHAARAALLGDPRGGPIDVAGMRRPDPGRAVVEPVTTRATGDTVAVCAVDDEGRSAALIQSVFQSFGAGLLEPGTGIVLHNRGSAFRLADGQDAHDAVPGRLAPGLRPPHTLSPLLAQDGELRLALGCQGGRAQPLILAQVGRGTLDRSASLADVLAAPRWVVGDRDLGYATETVLAEPGAEPGTTALPVVSAAGPDDRCGHVSVARALGTDLQAAADPRADGRAATFGATVTPDELDDPRRS